MGIARLPELSSSATSWSAISRFFVKLKATLAPLAASSFTIARPIPREPPVIMATLPSNSDMSLLSTLHAPLVHLVPDTRTGRHGNSAAMTHSDRRLDDIFLPVARRSRYVAGQGEP